MTRMNNYACSDCKKNGTINDNPACNGYVRIKNIRPKRLTNFVKFTNINGTIFYIRKDLITELTDEKIKDDKYEYQIWWQEGNTRRYEGISLEEYERLVEEVLD